MAATGGAGGTVGGKKALARGALARFAVHLAFHLGVRLSAYLAAGLAVCQVALVLAGFPAAAAQAPAAPVEYQVKAAYLYKFASFVEWPAGSFARPDSPLQIGVAGSDALADELELLVAGRSAGGHPLTVRRVQRGDSVAGLHILFVGAAERGAMADLLAAARGQSVLTVSDSDQAFALGSMINFVVTDERLRFHVALGPVNSSRLRISARMLAAALSVQGAPS